MAGTYVFNPFENSSAPDSKSRNVEENVKHRIYQKFEKTFKLDELSLPAGTNDNPPLESETITTIAGNQWPLIKINDYMLSADEITSLEIDSTGFIPKIVLKVFFMHQTFLSREIAKDGDVISIAIRNKSDLLKGLRNDYVITGVVSSQNSTQIVGPVAMTFFGVLFIPWLDGSKFNFSYKGTTYGAMKKLAETIGVGFATNEVDTDDKQIWLSGTRSLIEFIKFTSERSWKDDKSFYDIWIDIYYNLNFINVNKQLMSGEDDVDLAAVLNNIDKDYTHGESIKQSEVIPMAKVFSNYRKFRTSSFYISSWRGTNKSTKITFDVGSKLNCNLFEHNYNLYKDPASQSYWKLPIEPMYDPDKTNKYILLRGRATQDTDKKGKDLAKANYSYPDMYITNPWMGIQYTISNPEDDSLQWDGNHHKNYIRAKAQNLINNKELEKINVEITVNGINLNVIKGDKTPVVLIKKDVVENALVNKDSAGMDLLEQFYSGWFYVSGYKINYNQSNKESIMSNFTQTFIMTRREWPPPIAVNAIKKEKNNI